MSTPPEDAIGAALLKMTEYGERIGVLDEREAEHFRAVTGALHELRTTVNGVEGTIADQAEILGSLNGLDEAVARLAEQITPLLPPAAPASDRYQPADTVRWWRLQDSARTEPIARLRNWVNQNLPPALRVSGCTPRTLLGSASPLPGAVRLAQRAVERPVSQQAANRPAARRAG